MLRRLLSSLAPPKSHRLTGENDLPLAAVRVAGCLIEELAGIGAKIETTGNDLVLRAGPHPIPSQLVRRVRDAKSDLIAVLRTNSLESQVVRRIDKHPVPSLTGQRAWCGKRERSDAVVRRRSRHARTRSAGIHGTTLAARMPHRLLPSGASRRRQRAPKPKRTH